MLAMLLMLQVAGPPGDEVAPVLRSRRCAPANGDEITVCATDPDAYRLAELTPPPGTMRRPIKARASATLAPGVKVVGAAEPEATKEGTFMRAMAHVTIAF